MIAPSRVASLALLAALTASVAVVIFCAATSAERTFHQMLVVDLLELVCILGLVGFAWGVHRHNRQLRHCLRQLAQRPVDTWPEIKLEQLDLAPWWASGFRPLLESMRTLAKRLLELEQKQLHQHLEQRNAPARSFRLFLESLSDPVLLLDGQGQLTVANSAARRVLALAPEMELPVPIDQLDEPWLTRLWQSLRQRRVPGTVSCELQREVAGAPRWYEAAATSFGTPEAPEEFAAWSVILHDHTPLKTVQQRHAEFVSAVSHEMKAPLAGIRAYTEMLLDGEAEDPDTLEEFLRVIDSQADRLRRLIENLLNLARIEAGVVQVEKKVVPLNEVLEEAVRVLKPTAEEKSIQLRSELSPLCLRVLGDRDQLLQAAINLVSNAIKYTPQGGWVVVRSRSRDDRVQFEVEDSGVGMTAEEVERVFDKFYRIKKNNHMASGTGLGLPLAKSIIRDLHGGEIRVESNPGQGSLFIVELPSAGGHALRNPREDAASPTASCRS